MCSRKLDQIQRFVDYGLYFGYPECCIHEFVQHCVHRTYLQRSKRKLTGTGYVPCEKCNEKTVVELLETIAKNRKAPQPFPNDSELFNELLKKERVR